MELPARTGRKFWMNEVDQWMLSIGRPRMTWEQVIAAEGGYGGVFYKTAEDAKLDGQRTHPARWFNSDMRDFGLYNEVPYVYSLLFGATMISGQVYSHFGGLCSGEEVNDVGGSIFTAVSMLKRGVTKVYLTNVEDSPQLHFARYIIDKFSLPIEICHNPKPFTKTIMSEYLEHFEYPVAEWGRVAHLVGPGIDIACANSFCMPAYGHFIPIKIKDLDDGEVKECFKTPIANKIFKKMVTRLGTKFEPQKLFNKTYYITQL